MAYVDRSTIGQPNGNQASNGRMINGVWTVPQAGFGFDANGQIVNLAQQQLAEQARSQAQQDLAGLGSPAQIAAQSAAAADPFASQRGQYQNSLAQLMNGKFSTSDPSYAWRVGQGQQALERSAAAKGYLGSGNILAELQNYGQNQGSQEYQNQYNRLLPLTGAQSGSPAAAGTAIAATYGWRNNALANLGGAQQLQGPQAPGASYSLGSTQGANSYTGGSPMFGGSSGSSGGGSFNPGSFLGGGSSAVGGYNPGGGSLGTTAAESNNALARQMAAQFPGYGGGLNGGGVAGSGDPYTDNNNLSPMSGGSGMPSIAAPTGGGTPGVTPVGGIADPNTYGPGNRPSSDHGEGWMWTGKGWQRTQ